ncbi:DoxX family protein [Lutibacter sp.]|uniref:DoxX family protein n=1 Tax=Lutibacter sp. TaxID=1925666 RepID=UPI00273516DC|nr:DoxX family protein [Lutibacter sp.]MDP3312065.1 DoxX family protein [Lutibacter sp.]
MNVLTSLSTSLDTKTGTAYSLIRIFLGIALTVRGWLILANPESLIDLGVNRELFVWVSLVGVTHLIGGVLLCIGFLTRLGALIQIPILFSAAFFIHAHTKLMMGGQSIELASLVLFLLCMFFVFGAGSFSITEFMSNKK